MPRRGNHEGHIRQRGSRWEGAVMVDGRRRTVTGRTRAEVTAKLRALVAQGAPPPPSREPLSRYLDRWLDGRDLRPRTRAEYARIFACWTEALGDPPLSRLRADHVASVLARWRDAGLSGGTLLNRVRALHAALADAHRHGLIPDNPMSRLRSPRAERRRPELWDPDQAARFLRAAAAEPGPWGPLWALLLGTGCRVGEALALTWGDLEGGTARIRRSVGWVGGRLVTTAPKTAAGVRDVPLPGFALAALRRWRREQAEARLRAGPAWEGGDLVFTHKGGRPLRPWASVARLRALCDRLGLPRLRVHDLRHLHASLLLQEGLSVPEVAARLGHAGPNVTMSIYAHALRDGTAAVAALEAALSAR